MGHATTKSWKSSIWVFPQFWNSSVVQNLQLCKIFSVSVVSLHWLYRYIWVYVLYIIHLWLILQVDFSAKWMWSDPSPSMLYSTQSIHKFFMCILFETRSKSSLCPCQLKNLRTELLTYLIKFLALPLKLFRIPRNTYLFTHDLTRSPLLSTWVTYVKRMRRVRGTFVQFLRANRFSS